MLSMSSFDLQYSEQAFKVKNGHLEHLLKLKDYDTLESLLPTYLCTSLPLNVYIVDFRDRWDHWVHRFL
jgi:hypothetical protein